ncbi:MAG: exodeoxyribonuclease VII large subunit [Ardenticatenaceae bacterium]|nr:exodeoxyribonuclease VII large subunit [Ardenticatenaceae bacterium]
MSLFDSSPEESAVWSVAELTAYIKEMFDIDFRLQDVEVEGEISNFVQARSGHLYFTIKDSKAQIRCVMWRSAAAKLRFDPQDGDQVLVQGRVSVYEAGGNYQLYASRLRPAGRGDLALAFEELKQRLADEGLFEAERKQPLPRLPKKIGIVTSLDAAGLRDILNVLRRRYPIGQVLIAPTLVQGHEAPPRIVDALRWLDGRDDIDVIIMARGGGSIEDLWAFNDEGVARAMATTRTPIITGVGHEIDFTIADFVADVRAPTPSAAAEIVAPDLSETANALRDIETVLQQLLAQRFDLLENKLSQLVRTLRLLNPRGRIDQDLQRLDYLRDRLYRQWQAGFTAAENQLQRLQGQLAAVSPQATLARGYAIVRDDRGKIVRSVTQVADGQALEIAVADGEIPAVVDLRSDE